MQYLSWIKKYSIKFKVIIFAYCLMSNHIYFIVTPTEKQSLAKVVHIAHVRYARYFNKKTGRKGHLWQGRLKSCVLDELHLLRAARYIERNPVIVGMVQKPWQWAWSSALHNTGRKDAALLLLGDLPALTGKHHTARENYIDSVDEPHFLHIIRKQTAIGRPLGNNLFIRGLETQLRRNLATPSIGRPKNK